MIRGLRNAIQPVNDKCNMHKDDINKILGSFINKDIYAGNEEGVLFMSSSEPVRSKRYKYIVCTDDREIEIREMFSQVSTVANINVFGKVYFTEEDGSITFLSEDKYSKYEWENYYE